MAGLEIGVQFHLPTYAHVPLPHLVELSREAEARGVSQMWVTDNLRSRQSYVTLAAMACNLNIKLGTAVTVQYFRNPVDLADSVATLSELMDGRELSIGLGRGNPRTPRLIRTPRPVSVLQETAQSLRRLLDGEGVCFSDYPALLDYYHFNPVCHLPVELQPGIAGQHLLWQQRPARIGRRRPTYGRPNLRRPLPGCSSERVECQIFSMSLMLRCRSPKSSPPCPRWPR